MSKNWPTKEQDIDDAKFIITQYVNDNQCDSLGLFELIINQKNKSMNLQLSSWIMLLAKHFKDVYGAQKGDIITRQVITYYLTAGHTFH